MNETLMVAAAAHFDLGKLGRRATTQVFLTYLIHLFFPTPAPRHLPASGLINLPFAPARCAHPPTGPPPLSHLSADAGRRRDRRRALLAGAAKDPAAEDVHMLPTALRG